MAERSTARSADHAAHPEYEGRHGRHRHHQYEDQYEGAHHQHGQAYRRSDPLAYPAPGYDEPGRAELYDEHDHAYPDERRGHEWYRPVDASSDHEDAYGAQLDALPEAGYAAEGYYRHDVSAGCNEYGHKESGPQPPEAEEGARPRGKHSRGRVAYSRPARRRPRWLIPIGGLALGAVLCALPFLREPGAAPEAGPPVSAATTPPSPSEEPIAFSEVPSTPPSSATPRTSSATPSATPSVTPSATPS
ncbi:hypothetical protein ABZ570_33625, partial [Micromonospora sp. NPDC007271]